MQTIAVVYEILVIRNGLDNDEIKNFKMLLNVFRTTTYTFSNYIVHRLSYY